MTKIVHICLQGYIEGSGYQESILARCHKRMAMDVYVIAASNNGGKTHPSIQQHYINEDGINVTILAERKKKSLKWCWLLFTQRTIGIMTRLSEIKPDIIFVHGGGTNETWDIIKYKKENKNVKLYADSHSDYYNTPLSNSLKCRFLTWWGGRPIRALSKYVVKYWGVSPWRVDYLKNVFKVSEDKIDLLVMGGDDKYIDYSHKDEIRNRIRKQYNIPNNTFLVISGGRIMPDKNIDILAKAIEHLDNIKLLLVGNPVSSYEQLFNKIIANLHNTISVGWVKSNDIYDYFLASDLVVFPGTHSVLWEQAVASGIPLVVKKWDGMNHVDVGGNCAFLEEISINSLQDTLNKIVTEKDFYNKMKSVASSKGAEIFKYSNISKKAIGL